MCIKFRDDLRISCLHSYILRLLKKYCIIGYNIYYIFAIKKKNMQY